MTSILIIGGQNRGQSLASAADGFDLCGVHCECLFTRKIFRERNMPEDVLDAIKAKDPKKYDAVLFWNPKNEINPQIMKWVSSQTKTIYWTIDDPDWQEGGAGHRRACDIAFTCCMDSARAYVKEGQPAYLMYPPVNVNPSYYNWGVNPEWQCDVGFMASNCYTKETHPHILASRADMVRVAMEVADCTMVFGYWDDRAGGWGRAGGLTDKTMFGGWVKDQDIPRMTRSATINLNSHVRPQGSRYYNDRVMQTLGTGGFMLCDRIPDIQADFKEGDHLALWGDLDELREKIKYYLEHDEERRKIAAQGQMMACAKFSNLEFARETLRIISVGGV